MNCPKCGGWLHFEQGCFRTPEHVRCLICGGYWERPVKVVMPEIPPAPEPTVVYTPEQRAKRNERARRDYRRRKELAAIRTAARGAA